MAYDRNKHLRQQGNDIWNFVLKELDKKYKTKTNKSNVSKHLNTTSC